MAGLYAAQGAVGIIRYPSGKALTALGVFTMTWNGRERKLLATALAAVWGAFMSLELCMAQGTTLNAPPNCICDPQAKADRHHSNEVEAVTQEFRNYTKFLRLQIESWRKLEEKIWDLIRRNAQEAIKIEKAQQSKTDVMFLFAGNAVLGGVDVVSVGKISTSKVVGCTLSGQLFQRIFKDFKGVISDVVGDWSALVAYLQKDKLALALSTSKTAGKGFVARGSGKVTDTVITLVPVAGPFYMAGRAVGEFYVNQTEINKALAAIAEEQSWLESLAKTYHQKIVDASRKLEAMQIEHEKRLADMEREYQATRPSPCPKK